MATFGTALRAPFARHWLSGIPADAGDGAPPLVGGVAMLAWRHRRVAP